MIVFSLANESIAAKKRPEAATAVRDRNCIETRATAAAAADVCYLGSESETKEWIRFFYSPHQICEEDLAAEEGTSRLRSRLVLQQTVIELSIHH